MKQRGNAGGINIGGAHAVPAGTAYEQRIKAASWQAMSAHQALQEYRAEQYFDSAASCYIAEKCVKSYVIDQ